MRWFLDFSPETTCIPSTHISKQVVRLGLTLRRWKIQSATGRKRKWDIWSNPNVYHFGGATVWTQASESLSPYSLLYSLLLSVSQSFWRQKK